MAKEKKQEKSHPKKEFRNIIGGKLESALAEYRTESGEKVFNAAIKKGSKLLSALLASKKKKAKRKKIKITQETTENASQ